MSRRLYLTWKLSTLSVLIAVNGMGSGSEHCLSFVDCWLTEHCQLLRQDHAITSTASSVSKRPFLSKQEQIHFLSYFPPSKSQTNVPWKSFWWIDNIALPRKTNRTAKPYSIALPRNPASPPQVSRLSTFPTTFSQPWRGLRSSKHLLKSQHSPYVSIRGPNHRQQIHHYRLLFSFLYSPALVLILFPPFVPIAILSEKEIAETFAKTKK